LNAKGVAVVNLLQLGPEEVVSSVINVSKGASGGHLLMCTARGTIKKTPFEQYQNVRSSGLIAIKLDDGDELKWIRMTSGNDDVVISTAQGQAIRFSEKDARPMGRAARGVRGIRLRQGDQVIGMDAVDNDAYIFVISQFGYGKRTKVDQFTAHKRGGVGIRAAVVNKKTGPLVGVARLKGDDQEVIIISSQGQTIRLGLKDISALSRATQGVRIMRLNEGDSVVSLALIENEPEEEGESEQQELTLPAKAPPKNNSARVPSETKTKPEAFGSVSKKLVDEPVVRPRGAIKSKSSVAKKARSKK